RRDFTKVMGAVVAGMVAGSKAFAEDAKKAPEAKVDKHICKGHNECKGKGGGAAAAAKRECAGKHECKGMGGCKGDKHACAGHNECKGKGGCAIPLKEGHPPKAK